MSKLTALIAIPVLILGVKRLQETIKDETNPRSIFETNNMKQRDNGTFFGL